MRQSPMLNYPVSEYEARMSRAAEKVKQAGLSCIMGTSKAAVCHLTGLRSVIWESKAGTPGLLFLSAEGQYALVNSFTGVDAAMYSTCLERKDFINYDSSGRSGVATNQLGAMCYTLRHFGCTKGKIGCELGSGIHLHMRISLFEDLKKEFPDLEFVDATELIWDILADKSEAQLADLRQAETINAQAVAKGIEGLKPGVTTELELYKSIARQGYLCGSEHFTFMSLVSGPERALCADCPPSDEVISAEPGTIIRVEGGAIRNELNAPFAANIVVGGVQPGQEPAWELAQDMISAAMAAVKPGAPASSVAAAMDACAEVQGKADWSVQPGYAGSGIGWGRIDGPLLSKNSKSVLRAGMALTLQASVRHSSLGMLILRQNVVVTEGGCAFLNGKTTEPLIV